MKLIGVVRLGRDAEQRFTPSGQAVLNFSGAFNYGRKDGEGNRPSQWIEFALWGDRGEKLAQYLTRGAQVFISASEPHIETYEKNDGTTGAKLLARVDDVQLIGSRQDSDGAAPARAPAAAPRSQAPAPRQPAPKSSTGFDDMDDDIPF